MGAVVVKVTVAVALVVLAVRLTGEPEVTLQPGMSTALAGVVATAQLNAMLPA